MILEHVEIIPSITNKSVHKARKLQLKSAAGLLPLQSCSHQVEKYSWQTCIKPVKSTTYARSVSLKWYILLVNIVNWKHWLTKRIRIAIKAENKHKTRMNMQYQVEVPHITVRQITRETLQRHKMFATTPAAPLARVASSKITWCFCMSRGKRR